MECLAFWASGSDPTVHVGARGRWVTHSVHIVECEKIEKHSTIV